MSIPLLCRGHLGYISWLRMKVDFDLLHVFENCHTSIQTTLCPKLPSARKNLEKRLFLAEL
jgi:hypothetical protein